MEIIRVVLIGLGNMGRHHLRAIINDDSFALVGVVDPHLDEMPPEWSDIPLFSQLDSLSDLKFDAAVVAAPTELHSKVVHCLFDLGKHVLVEKPAASTLEEARTLVARSLEQDLKLSVGHIERCNPAVDALSQVLDELLIGEPVHVSSSRCGAYPASIKPGNDVFLDLAVHELDVFARLFNKLEVVGGFYQCVREAKIPDLAEVSLSLPEGVRGTIHVDWLTPQKLRKLRVTGTKGVCELDYMNQTLGIYRSSEILKYEGALALEKVEHPFCHYYEVEVRKVEPIKRQLAEFSKFIRNKSHILCVGQEIIESLTLLDDCSTKTSSGLLSPRLS